MKITVGVSDAKVSNNPEVTIVTYSLGSCIGVTLYDPVAKVGGMLHFQLPAATDPARVAENPFMFAETGLARILEKLAALGGQEKRYQVTISGAAQMLGDANMFNIGRRNHAAIRKLLWQRGMLIKTEEIGGTSPRNVYLSIADGSVEIKVVGFAAVGA